MNHICGDVRATLKMRNQSGPDESGMRNDDNAADEHFPTHPNLNL